MRQLENPKTGDIIAKIGTSMGDIKVVLFPEVAPKAVENFTSLAQDGYYNGIIFHRVIEDFMIQGGDPTGTGRGGQSIYGRPFEDEFSIEFRNFRGALSMANAGPGTNGSQFFIVQASEIDPSIIDQMRQMTAEDGFPEELVDAYEKYGGAYWLDFRHTVFGQVYQGMDIVDEISKVEKDQMDKPLEDVVIKSIEISEVK